MAEAIFDALAEDSGLRFRAGSAGVAAHEGDAADPRATETLAEIGVYASSGRIARQVTGEAVADADLVLAMTPPQADDLRRLFGAHAGKIHSLAKYVDDDPHAGISDPHGHTSHAYRASARQLLGYLEPLVTRLKAQPPQLPAGSTTTGGTGAAGG